MDTRSSQEIDLACPICKRSGLDQARAIALWDRRKGLAGQWQALPCPHCEVLSLYPMPSETELADYYAAYARDENIDLNLKSGSRHPALRKLFHWLSGDVDPRDFVTVPAGGRILDYGCGLAGYLSDFHARGIAISGAEIAAYVVEACRAKGLNVRRVEHLSVIPFDDAEFDVVYLMQVFEHLRDPHGFMDELARIVKPGGHVHLAVPNAGSVWRRLFKSHWISGWFAPFHLYHYNRQNLAQLAREHGFEPCETWTRTPESWFRLNLKAALLPHEGKLDWRPFWLDRAPFRLALMLALRLIELPIRERDCLVMKLRKA